MTDTTTRDDGVRDVIVIGSGPAGYAAALYTARAQLRPLLFGSSIFVGGSLTTTTEVENFPGVFVAGDVVDHTYHQAITAAGSGAVRHSAGRPAGRGGGQRCPVALGCTDGGMRTGAAAFSVGLSAVGPASRRVGSSGRPLMRPR